ncbi:hypothetical protein CNR22_04315 [Sphingobacteriaceae bacterium]|nr:hypothetical protein CNR22_04315 [Sphingobacteriaceae bacterium]
MGLKTLIAIFAFVLISGESFSQDYFSYGASNFAGINQIFSNPAAAADNRIKLDVVLTGLDFTFNNSWFNINRAALKYKNGSFPDTWQNVTPRVPDNMYKNFNFLKSTQTHSVLLENRILLPSVLFQINSKNSIAFTWSVRQMLNVDGISEQLAYLFENEFDLNATQNNRVQNKNLAATQMSWAEYGFTYARVLKNKNKHFLKAGITPKILQGLESGYLRINDLDFLLSSKDTNSYFNATISYAHSDNFNSPTKNGQSVTDFYRGVSKLQLGLDLGIIYEWRPDFQKYKYKPDGKKYAWRKDLNKYKIKFGASLVDVGKIKFDKKGTNYDLNLALRRDNVTKYTTASDFNMVDSFLVADFSRANGKTTDYSIMLPTALNTQIDYSFNKLFYLNFSTHLTNFRKQSTYNVYRIHNYSSLCLAPRIEQYWFDVSVPFTYNVLSAENHKYITAGLNLRAGPLSIGTNNIMPLIRGDIWSFNFYAILKVSIPYKSIKDQDGDGVRDDKDLCPDVPGEISLNGCPDADHDNIADKEDACPHQFGIKAFRGCPDTDNDGVTDGQDKCPFDKGSPAMKGCPDTDNDLIPDKEDACPDVAGLKEFKGCPDTDKDGIVDKEDLCPNVKGLAKYKGCLDTDNDQVHDGVDECISAAGPADNKGCPWPDTDKDGITDRLDSCLTTPGIAELKGCPAPVKLAAAEKKILQKAFSSLEFESGKDIIKTTSLPSLNALAKLLVNHKGDWMLKLSGHTDNEGSESNNLILSENRSRAVQTYLIKKGAPQENILTEWFGQGQPIADNTTSAGRKKNRRVEMTVLMKVN